MLEQRRLQKLGYSTLMVSLPRDWVKQLNLKRGDTVSLSTDDQGRLIVHPSSQMHHVKKRCIIHTEKADDKMLGRLILGAYIAGHEVVELRTRSQEFTTGQLEVIRKTLNELIGMGIVEQGVNKIIIQSFLDPSKFPIDGLISRLHLIVDSMRDLAVKALIEERTDVAKQVLDMDVEADKVYFLATRQLLQAVEDKGLAEQVGLGNPRNIVGDRLVVKALEEVGDYAQIIARSALRIIDLEYFSSDVNKDVTLLNEAAKKIGALAMRALYKRDLQSANSAIIEFGSLAALEENVGSNLNRELAGAIAVATPLKSITQSLMQIGRYYTIAAETMINRAVETPSDMVEIIAEE
ncbi:MAG: PhoU domain-containing protein [Nitrososphaerales archaeon]